MKHKLYPHYAKPLLIEFIWLVPAAMLFIIVLGLMGIATGRQRRATTLHGDA